MLDESNGILIFVTSFLGLAFLIAAGCIIYIKQMDETEDEINNYRILRRIGFTHTDMTKGLALKILFNFGFTFNHRIITRTICCNGIYETNGRILSYTDYHCDDCLFTCLPYLCSNLIYPCKSNCKTLYLIIEKKGRCLNEY